MSILLALLLLGQSGPLNLNFEEGDAGRTPPGWRGTTSEITTDGTRKCAVVRFASPFGNLMQVVDAAPYRGKTIRFRASVRTDGASRAQLWLRVDRPGGIGFFDNMDSRPILSSTWSEYEINGDVDADAARINFGLIVVAGTRAWIDDAALEITGEAKPIPAEPGRPLSEPGLRNLVAFGRLLGYVRYFHPSDAAAATDWDTFAIEGVRKIEDASTPQDLAARLIKLFAPIAPKVQVFCAGQQPSNVERAEKMLYWRHHGVGLGGGGIYNSTRVLNSDAPQPYTAELAPGVSCLVPLALPAQTEPGPSTPSGTMGRWTGDDRATRLADVILAWNVFQHFYPYFDVVQTDWPKALETALTSAAADRDSKAFTTTLRRMVAQLHDGHGGVYSSGLSGARPPVRWDWIEGKLIITQAEGADLSPGDAVLAIDGKPVAEVLRDTEELISGATPQWIRNSALQQLAAGAEGSVVTLRVDPWGEPGKVRDVVLARRNGTLQPKRPPKVHETSPSYYYIDLTRINDDDWDDVLPRLAEAKGIVFDMRGYPGSIKNPMVLFGHLSPELMSSAQWHVPVVTMPDRQGMTFDHRPGWKIPPIPPYLKARKAFLTFGEAISYAESCMGIVEHYKLGEIVGGPTAGTNGNVNPFMLPGGYRITWTGMKVLKHDGSQHHGVGILPTVPVRPTRAGVAAGRDEVLERGLEVVKGQ